MNFSVSAVLVEVPGHMISSHTLAMFPQNTNNKMQMEEKPFIADMTFGSSLPVVHVGNAVPFNCDNIWDFVNFVSNIFCNDVVSFVQQKHWSDISSANSHLKNSLYLISMQNDVSAKHWRSSPSLFSDIVVCPMKNHQGVKGFMEQYQNCEIFVVSFFSACVLVRTNPRIPMNLFAVLSNSNNAGGSSSGDIKIKLSHAVKHLFSEPEFLNQYCIGPSNGAISYEMEHGAAHGTTVLPLNQEFHNHESSVLNCIPDDFQNDPAFDYMYNESDELVESKSNCRKDPTSVRRFGFTEIRGDVTIGFHAMLMRCEDFDRCGECRVIHCPNAHVCRDHASAVAPKLDSKPLPVFGFPLCPNFIPTSISKELVANIPSASKVLPQESCPEPISLFNDGKPYPALFSTGTRSVTPDDFREISIASLSFEHGHFSPPPLSVDCHNVSQSSRSRSSSHINSPSIFQGPDISFDSSYSHSNGTQFQLDGVPLKTCEPRLATGQTLLCGEALCLRGADCQISFCPLYHVLNVRVCRNSNTSAVCHESQPSCVLNHPRSDVAKFCVHFNSHDCHKRDYHLAHRCLICCSAHHGSMLCPYLYGITPALLEAQSKSLSRSAKLKSGTRSGSVSSSDKNFVREHFKADHVKHRPQLPFPSASYSVNQIDPQIGFKKFYKYSGSEEYQKFSVSTYNPVSSYEADNNHIHDRRHSFEPKALPLKY